MQVFWMLLSFVYPWVGLYLIVRFIMSRTGQGGQGPRWDERAYRREQAEREAQAARAAEAARKAEAVLVASLPPPPVARTVSQSVDLQAVETAAYAVVMKAHEEGWIESGDFAARADREARAGQTQAVPAAAVAAYAQELRLRGGFGKGA